jgi:hypothetical protein
MNHYYTKSVAEYNAKNARGDAQYNRRPNSALPEGLLEVYNDYIVQSVKHRLAAANSTALRQLLLSGGPVASSVAPEQFSASFVQDGMQKQRSGLYPVQTHAGRVSYRVISPQPQQLKQGAKSRPFGWRKP